MGIGASIAEALADTGAHLILFSRSEDKLDALAKSLRARNSKINVIFRSVDIQNYEAVNAAIESSIAELGDIDFLVNNVCFGVCTKRASVMLIHDAGWSRSWSSSIVPRIEHTRHSDHEQHQH